MASLGQLEWLYTTLGWAIALAGALLLAWSLSWDRPKGRRRCPRCWYDMRGVPTLTCPECGKPARSERSLGRTRRRWRWATIGIACIAAGWGVGTAPQVRAHGIAGAVPSSILLVWAGEVRDSWLYERIDRGRGTLSRELSRRYYNRELAHWQQRWVSRSLPGYADMSSDPGLHTRDHWPEGLPLMIWGDGHTFAGGLERRLVLTPLYALGTSVVEDVFSMGSSAHLRYHSSRQLPPPPAGAGSVAVRLDVLEQGRGDNESRSVLVWSTVMQLPVTVGGSPGSLLRAVETPPFAPANGVVTLSHLRHGLGWAHVHMEREVFSGPTPGFHIEFRHGADTVASVDYCPTVESFGFLTGDVARLALAAPVSPLVDRTDGQWSVHIRGDAAVALRDPKALTFWKGELVLPLEAVNFK